MSLMSIRRTTALMLAIVLTISSMVFTPVMAASGVFTDTSGHWAETYIEKWSSKGVIVGFGDGTFKPENNVTKAEFSSVLNQIFKYSATVPNTFADVNASNWFATIIQKVVAAGVVTPDANNMIYPNKSLTRGELFEMIAKAYDISPVTGETSFLDNASIDDSQKPYVKALQDTGMVVGYAVTNGFEIRTNSSLTRAEMLTVLDKADDEKQKLVALTPTPSSTPESEPAVLPSVRPSESVKRPTRTPTPTQAPTPDEWNTDKEAAALIEEYTGLSLSGGDTDGDGISDVYELTVLKTSPYKADTNEDGIPDGEEDADNDGLTNLCEYILGTNPHNPDSDGDGLSDYDEVEKYGTDPLKADTDGDGLDDGDEIKLGMDPNNPRTDGITLDSERTFEQTLDKDSYSDEFINGDLAIIPSISGKVRGIIDNNIWVDTLAADPFEDNRSVIGKAMVIASTYDDETTLKLSFDCAALAAFDIELVRRLVICEITSDGITLLDTSLVGTMISADGNTNGTYIVIDVDEFLSLLGINVSAGIVSAELKVSVASDIEIQIKEPDTLTDNNYQENAVISSELVETLEKLAENVTEPSETEQISGPPATESNISTWSLATETGVPMENIVASEAAASMGLADIVFVIDRTESMGPYINNVRNNIDVFAQGLVNDYNIHANFGLITFSDVDHHGFGSTTIHRSGFSNWFTSVEGLRAALSTISLVTGGVDYPETPMDGLEMARRLDFRSNATKFIILISDDTYKVSNQFGIESMQEMADRFANDEIIVSAISRTQFQNSYRLLYETTGGLFGNISANFSTILLALAEKIGEIVYEGRWVILDDFKIIRIDESPGADTDGDGIPDLEELGNITTTVSLTPFIAYSLAMRGVDPALYVGKDTVEVYNYISDPTKADTDGDGLLDGSAIYVTGRKIAPRDPEPRVPNGPIGVWQEQIANVRNGRVQTDYGKSPIDKYIDDQKANLNRILDIGNPIEAFQMLNEQIALMYIQLSGVFNNALEFWGGLLGCITWSVAESVNNIGNFLENNMRNYIRNSSLELLIDSPEATAAGATILGFRYDAAGINLHSHVDNWQKDFGYNKLYDFFFNLGTPMSKEMFPFNRSEYIVWMWRGDYMNLGAGAEIGIYRRVAGEAIESVLEKGIKHVYEKVSGDPHYTVALALPMTLNLYNYHSRNNIETLINWAPRQDQWWICGFNPAYTKSPNPAIMTVLGSINFSSRRDLYQTLKTDTQRDLKLKDFMIFDDESNLVWIIWWKKA